MLRSPSIALALLGSLACSGPAGPVAQMTAPDLRTLPWPSDALLGDDGRLHVAGKFPFDAPVEDSLTQLQQTLSELDGFGTTSSIFFPVDAPLIVDPGAAAAVIDLDAPSTSVSYPLFYRAETKQLVAVQPIGAPLSPVHHYAALVTAGVHDAGGHPLRPSPAMSDLFAGRGPLATKGAYPELARLLSSMKPAPLAATAFTTRSLTLGLPKILADLAALPPKATFTRLFKTPQELTDLFGGAVTQTPVRPGRPPAGGVVHDAVGLVLEGRFDTPHYLSPTPGTLGLFDAAETVRATDHVPFLIALPVATSYANIPVIIFQHGINGDRSAVLMVANDYVRRGYAVIGIDELWHGSRRPGVDDKLNNISGAAIPDGIGDPCSTCGVQFFFDFNGDSLNGIPALDPRYMRDNFRQATVDLMQLVRFCKSGDLSALAAADPALAGFTLDGSKVVYTGESFGSILGSQVMALDPAVGAAVLDVGGGGFILDLVARSASFAQLLQPFVAGSYDDLVNLNRPDTEPLHAQMSLGLLASVIEPGDGLPLAATADPGKQVLFLTDFSDEVVPNSAEEALAKAWGASQVTLPSKSRPTSVVTLPQVALPYSATPLRALIQLDPATHGMFTSQTGQQQYAPGFPPFTRQATPVNVDNPIEAVHQLALDFIDSYRAGAPVIKLPAGL